MAKNNLILLIIVFVAITLMALATITMISKIEQPDVNETPELYEESQEMGEVTQPFLWGLNGLIVVFLAVIFIVGIIFILNTIKRSMGGF